MYCYNSEASKLITQNLIKRSSTLTSNFIIQIKLCWTYIYVPLHGRNDKKFKKYS